MAVRYCIQAPNGKFLKITPQTAASKDFSPICIGPQVSSKPYDYKTRARAEEMLAHIDEYVWINTSTVEQRNDPIGRRDWAYARYVDSLAGAKVIEIA